MFDTHHASNLHLQHRNPDTMHPLAFIPSSEFINWLDTLQGNNTISTNKAIDDKEASDD